MLPLHGEETSTPFTLSLTSTTDEKLEKVVLDTEKEIVGLETKDSNGMLTPDDHSNLLCLHNKLTALNR